MNISEILSILKKFPDNYKILNAPTLPHIHEGKAGLAFVKGNHFITLEEMIEQLELSLCNNGSLAGNKNIKITENTSVYLVAKMHHVGETVKGLLVNEKEIVFVSHI